MIRSTHVTVPIIAIWLIASCAQQQAPEPRDLVNDPFLEEQSELKEAVHSIVRDAETANLEGLKDIHLVSDKFTKFGPRNFERQGVQRTNESELAFFGTVTNYKEKVDGLKVDVFGDVGIATYYREVSYIEDSVERSGNLRQTLVFVKTADGWKIVHEHGTRPQKPPGGS